MVQTYTDADKLAVLCICVAFGLVGGGICEFINQGIQFPKRIFNGFKIPAPSKGKFEVTPLLGMIIFSLIARNYFGTYMDAFPEDWGQWIRNLVLAVVLTASGLRLSLEGKGRTVILMCFIPFLLEGTIHGFLGTATFKMPLSVAFTLGFSVSAIATSVITSVLLPISEAGYGIKKDIAFTIIASAPFENIFTIICHGISKTISQ
jgi:hypothetical protein